MAKFPRDAPKRKVLKTLQVLGFELVKEAEHIALKRQNADGSTTPMTIPNHRRYKSSTLLAALLQAGVARDAFLNAYHQ